MNQLLLRNQIVERLNVLVVQGAKALQLLGLLNLCIEEHLALGVRAIVRNVTKVYFLRANWKRRLDQSLEF